MKEEIKVNRNCVNAKVQAHILSEPEMRKTGFTDYFVVPDRFSGTFFSYQKIQT